MVPGPHWAAAPRAAPPRRRPEDGGEVFGYVSYTREHEGAQAGGYLRPAADFTD